MSNGTRGCVTILVNDVNIISPRVIHNEIFQLVACAEFADVRHN